MDRIRVDTELLTECGISIGRSGNAASSLAEDIRSVLRLMPDCCTEKYALVVQSYEKEVRSISADLKMLSDNVDKAVERFSECEKYIRERSVFEDAPNAQSGEGTNSKVDWNKWPFSWIDEILDWLGIDEQGRDYEQDHIRDQISDLFDSAKYSRATWKKASVEEKKQILNNLLSDLNKIYGTNITKEIYFFTKDADSRGSMTLGYYSDSQQLVAINTNILDNDHYDQIMNTMVHEMRHAYQHEVVRHPEQFTVDEETVNSWRENIDDYISYSAEKNNYDDYRYQPIEKDAHDIADHVNYG